MTPTTALSFGNPFAVGTEWRFPFNGTNGVPADGAWQLFYSEGGGGPVSTNITISSTGAGDRGYSAQGQAVDYIAALNWTEIGDCDELQDISIRLVDSNSNPAGIMLSPSNWADIDFDFGTCN